MASEGTCSRGICLQTKLPGIITAYMTTQPCAGRFLPPELGQGSFRGERRFRARLLVWPPCLLCRHSKYINVCLSQAPVLHSNCNRMYSCCQINLVMHNAQLTCAMLAPICIPASLMEATHCITVRSGSYSDELGNLARSPGSKHCKP